jgi:hypothetical protein
MSDTVYYRGKNIPLDTSDTACKKFKGTTCGKRIDVGSGCGSYYAKVLGVGPDPYEPTKKGLFVAVSSNVNRVRCLTKNDHFTNA